MRRSKLYIRIWRLSLLPFRGNVAYNESLEAQGPTLCFFCLDDLGKIKHRDVINFSFLLFFFKT